jgi:hypothetical protein
VERAALRPSLLPALLAQLAEKTGEAATVEELDGMTQKALSIKIDAHKQRQLTEHLEREGDVRDLARMASLRLPHAGDWLNALPSPALGLHLRPQEFVAAARLRLGAPVFAAAGPCPACLVHSDAEGDHALCCAYQGERIARHNHLRDALYRTAVGAALGPTREGRFLLPGNDRRPADLFLPNWTGGRDSALDVTVTHPLRPTVVERAAAEPGYAAEAAFKRKMADSAEDCLREGIVFLPLAVESLGGWHPVAIQQGDKLASALARHTGEEERVANRHFWQRMSVLLQKGNTALILNRMPTTTNQL